MLRFSKYLSSDCFKKSRENLFYFMVVQRYSGFDLVRENPNFHYWLIRLNKFSSLTFGDWDPLTLLFEFRAFLFFFKSAVLNLNVLQYYADSIYRFLDSSTEKRKHQRLKSSALNLIDTCLRLQLIKKRFKTTIKQLANKLNELN